MRMPKPKYCFADYKAIVAKVEAGKERGLKVPDACAQVGIERRAYDYARQMLRRGKPMEELGLKP